MKRPLPISIRTYTRLCPVAVSVLRVTLFLAMLAPAPVSGATPEEIRRARSLASEGVSAFRAKQFELALEKLHEANRLVPHPNLDVNIGRIYLALKQSDKALVNCKIALNAAGVPTATRAAAQACVEQATAMGTRPAVRVGSEPPGARLRIDGREVGVTPWQGSVEPGRRQIDLDLPGHQPVSKTLMAARGQKHAVNLQLQPLPTLGRLSIVSAPAGAFVRVDGQPAGTTPIEAFELPKGEHVVQTELSGYSVDTRHVNIVVGESIELSFLLVPVSGFGSTPGGRPQWPTWALAGVGVVAMAVGGWAGMQAVGARDDADALVRGGAGPEDRGRYDDLVGDMNSRQTLADAMFVSSGVALAGAAAWWFWPASSENGRDLEARDSTTAAATTRR